MADRKQEGEEVSEHGAFRRHPGGRDEHQTTHQLRSAGGEPDGCVAPHRVADEVHSLEACGVYPFREPRSGLGKDEPLAQAPHRPETRKIYQVDPVRLGDGPDVSEPPASRSRESVHQDDGLSLPGYLVANRASPYPDFMP